MPTTRRKTAAAAVVKPGPSPALRRSARLTRSTSASVSAAAPVPESGAAHGLEGVAKEPTRKRQRRRGPAPPADAESTADTQVLLAAAGLSQAQTAVNEPLLAPVVNATSTLELALALMPRKSKGKRKVSGDESAPKMGKSTRRTRFDELILEDWVPHAIDEVVPDLPAGSSLAAVANSQAALLSQQHFPAALAAVPSLLQIVEPGREEGGGEGPAEATSWWRFFPDVLSATPETDSAQAGADDDDALLAAAARDRSAYYDGFGPNLNGNHDGATPVHVDGNGAFVAGQVPALKSGLASNEKELFMSKEKAMVWFRLPMPPSTLDTATSKCVEPTILADAIVRYVPVLCVRRPSISVDGHFVYSFGSVTEEMQYVHPRSMLMTQDELKALTLADFADLETADPYYERAKRVRPSMGHEYHEELQPDGFVISKKGIDRAILNHVVFSLKSDAFWRHDGDWPEHPGSNFHQDSCATGRIFVAWSGGQNVSDWNPDQDQYYRVVLRSIKGEWYPPPDQRASPVFSSSEDLHRYPYDVCVYLKTDAADTVLRDGREVPGLKDLARSLLSLLQRRNESRPFRFYVPDTLEGGHEPAPTPPGFQLELHDFQQRALSWLLALERSRRARTIHVRQITGTTTARQRAQFAASDLRFRPNWIQLGPGGMWLNSASFDIAADPAVWANCHLGSAGLECRGALEVSKMGAGKTIMALSLVAANPFRSVRGIVWDKPAERLKYLVSRATLVVVRSDLVTQWVAEAKKSLPVGSKILQVATIRDHRSLSWNDVLLADVVVVSLAFLQNPNYQKRVTEVADTKGGYCMPRGAYKPDLGTDMWPDRHKRMRIWWHALTPDKAKFFNDRVDAHMAGLHERTRAQFGTDKNCVIFERVHWHRIVIDEIHEWSHAMSARAHHRTNTRTAETLVFTMKTRFRLGLTGTPPLTHPEMVLALAEAVGVRNLPSTVSDAQAFLNTHVRRNNPDLEIPPVHYATQWVDLTPAEVGLMASYQGQSIRSRLMMCNHHQIHEDVVAAMGATATSVDEVAAQMQVVRLNKIESFVKQGRKLQEDIAVLTAHMEALVPVIHDDERANIAVGLTITDDNRLVVLGTDAHERLVRYLTAPDADDDEVMDVPIEILRVELSRVNDALTDAKTTGRKLVQACTDFAAVSGQLRVVAAQHRFMATVLTAIAEDVDQACPVCMEDIARTDPLVITRCGHIYCDSCTQTMLARPRRMCAMCRGDLDGAGATTRLVLHPADESMAEQEDDDVDEDADYAIYGSKIKALVQFVRRVVRADPTAKLILFSQFHRLTALMAHAFTEFGIGNVKLMGGNVLSKRRAITLFRNDAEMKVLFLSAEDSVSGLQLTEANHVVIVHPFLGASEAMARANEMQGCARAVRAGQGREVTITRFVMRGTIEEELTALRSDLHRPETVLEGTGSEEGAVGN
ncbi:hypothetical protein AMAG_13127 [Allomyces macrogynus ATCC 38327]|uniref:RING-type domain-containing protein n=1 Tax=Allomyces macrogynus (strain ATCC 38327) TaxID=578462 RepID=A0A0L0SZV2_ALLM3|nr:hypothetical protein AMAG_13127 [Allomyces macrogynus ATCC 38327]|eukprot:KNE67940.1 hypothetical protein AMAG_13127 [Allomyces macrogynus ATCC 38327]